MCLGLNFAYMQAKCFTCYLNRFRVAIASNFRPAWDIWLIPYPVMGSTLF